MIDNDYKTEIAKILIDIESVKFSFKNPFTLTSGHKSPVYVDCRKIISFMKERNIILKHARNYLVNNNIEYDLLAGGETAGIPYASILSEQLQKKMIYIRKKPKGFGKNQQIEGSYLKDEKVLLIEDLATDGGSKIIFIEAILEAGLKVEDVFVIFYYDIFDFTKSKLFDYKIKIHSLCTWKDIINVIENQNLFKNDEVLNLKLFLNKPDVWRQSNE